MKNICNSPVRILLSGKTMARLEGRIRKVFGDDGCFELVQFDETPGNEPGDIHIAFISRDITGKSTKFEVMPTLNAFYVSLRRSPHLSWVHTHSAGADRPIFPELLKRGVSVTTSSGANADIVAQMALTGLLMLAREFPRLMQSQAKRLWAPLIATGLPRDIAGQRVTIVGWGPIARSLAAMLEMLGMSVSVVRNSPEPAGQGRKTVTFPEIDTVLTTSDWLVLACPLTDTTRDLIDARRLRCLPRGARLINVARGEVVVEPDLVKALEDNYLAGAYLDVFAYEPLAPDSPLWSLPNVIVTPHTAGHSDGNEARVDQIFLDHLATWVSEATREREPLPGDRTLQ